MGDKILVIGASSKVGTELVKALQAKGQAVKAATRRPGDYDPAPGVEEVAFDFDVPESGKPALADVDRLFLMSHWTDLHPEMELNRLIEQARTAGVRHVVFMSALGVDKQPVPGLPLVEKRLANSGMGHTFLRPNWLMQNFSRGFMLPTVRDISYVIVPAGDARVSFVDARDVAAVAAAALTEPGHEGMAYNLTGGESLTYAEAADTLGDALGRRITYERANEQQFREILGDRWDGDQRAYLERLFGYVREGQAADVDPTLGTVLGRPPTPFADFVRDHVDVWR